MPYSPLLALSLIACSGGSDTCAEDLKADAQDSVPGSTEGAYSVLLSLTNNGGAGVRVARMDWLADPGFETTLTPAEVEVVAGGEQLVQVEAAGVVAGLHDALLGLWIEGCDEPVMVEVLIDASSAFEDTGEAGDTGSDTADTGPITYDPDDDVDDDGLADGDLDWLVAVNDTLCFSSELVPWSGDVYVVGWGFGGEDDWNELDNAAYEYDDWFCFDFTDNGGAYRVNVRSSAQDWGDLASYCDTVADPLCWPNPEDEGGGSAVCLQVDRGGVVSADCSDTYGPPTVTVGCTDSVFTSIQDAADASEDGSEIAICGGTYAETLRFEARVLTLRAESETGTVYVDGDSTDSVLYASNSQLDVEGITFRDGYSLGYGGGAHLRDTEFTCTDCTFRDNRADFGGGGLFVLGGTFVLTDSDVRDNEALGDNGGGLFIYDGAVATVSGSTISGNSSSSHGGGLYVGDGTTVTNTSSVFDSNRADYGGAATLRGTVDFTDVDVLDNAADTSGGGFESLGTIYFQRGSFTGNTATTGGTVVNCSAGMVTLDGTEVRDNSGGQAGFGLVVIGTIVVTDATIEDNTGHASGVGGVEVQSYGTVVSTDTYWSNIGGDALTAGDTYTWGGVATFTCDEDECY